MRAPEEDDIKFKVIQNPNKKRPPMVIDNELTEGPSMFTIELFSSICRMIADGIPLRQICRMDGMPSYDAFYDWIEYDEQKPEEERLHLGPRFARARLDGFDAIAAETLEIADNANNDWMERLDKKGATTIGWQLNGEHVMRSKLRVETRLKLLAKWDPKRYGDKLEVTDTAGAFIRATREKVVSSITPQQAYLKAIGKEVDDE